MRSIKYRLENETAKLNKLTAIITLIGAVILVLNGFLSKEKTQINNSTTNNTYINNNNYSK